MMTMAGRMINFLSSSSSSYSGYKAFRMVITFVSLASMVSSALSWNVMYISKTTNVVRQNHPYKATPLRINQIDERIISHWLPCRLNSKLPISFLRMSNNYEDETEVDINDDDTAEWKAVLAAFKMYKAAYGDLRIPLRFIVPSMPPWPSKSKFLRDNFCGSIFLLTTFPLLIFCDNLCNLSFFIYLLSLFTFKFFIGLHFSLPTRNSLGYETWTSSSSYSLHRKICIQQRTTTKIVGRYGLFMASPYRCAR
jgi:hypothetical protein